MAKGFDNLHIKSAVKSRNDFDLSCTHLTTMNFGEIVPLYCEETIPGDKFNIDANYFSRMAPLVRPTYGKFSFKTMTCFVPDIQIADDAEAFLAGKKTWEGETPHLRGITMNNFVRAFVLTDPGLGEAVTSAQTYDFHYIASNGADRYVRFTPAGKYAYKIMTSLGYTLPENCDLQTGSTWWSENSATTLNAMPLIAFAKAYNDYMSQSQRFNSSELTRALRLIKHDKSGSTWYNATAHNLTDVGLASILKSIKLCYENDYFTSAWQYPNSPLSTTDSISYANVPNGQSGDYDVVENGLYNNDLRVKTYPQLGGDALVYLNQRSLDFLKSFDDWVRRNNYSGSRAVQQVYSRFGIKTDDYRSNYAHVLGTDVMPVQVGDVTAMASSSDEALGDYAGKGIMNGSHKVQYEAKDYGYLFIFGYFTIKPMNAYGFDRKVLRTEPLDFYNPEFDGLGAEAISKGEFFANPLYISGDTTQDTGIFGFTERYNSYRYGRDKITGEFRNYNPNSDMNSWHTGRLLTDVRVAGNMVAQSSDVNTLSPISSEYNRIFSDTSSDVDKFYLTAQFNVSAVRPMLSLNQVPRLGEGDTNVPKNGNVIN